MAKEIENEDGTKETVYTQAEMEAHTKTEIEKVQADTTKTVAEKDAEIARLNKVNAEKTDNFKRYNDMTEAERAAYDANTTELLKRNDLTAAENADLKARLDKKEKDDADRARAQSLERFHQNDEATKKALEENYALLAGMPETTPEEISARAAKAASMAGISPDSQNPLYASFNGEPPVHKEKKEYTDSAQGAEAAALVRAALNIPEPKK